MNSHERKMEEFSREYDVSSILNNNQLSEYLQSIKDKTDAVSENIERINQSITTSQENAESAKAISSECNNKLNKLTELIGQSQFINGQIQSTLETVIKTLGSAEHENSIIGQLTQISTLKHEFSENIQNINMIIGQNVPGEETGFYRLLNEAKAGKVQYYKFRIPEEAKKYKKLVITLPDYIANKGNSFIVRTYNDHKNFVVQYDESTKKLHINLGNLNSSTDIIILPIRVVESGISESSLEFTELRDE